MIIGERRLWFRYLYEGCQKPVVEQGEPFKRGFGFTGRFTA